MTDLLVYFHGYGSHPSLVHPFFRTHHDDGWTRLCPCGPYGAADGHAWFESGPRGVDWPSLTTAVGVASSVIDDMCAGLDIDHRDVVLAGFSQGGAFALALASGGARSFGGLLLQAAFLPEGIDGELDLTAISTPAVLLQHGRADDVVPLYSSEDLAAALAATDRTVELELFDGAHAVTPAMIDASADWLGRQYPLAQDRRRQERT